MNSFADNASFADSLFGGKRLAKRISVPAARLATEPCRIPLDNMPFRERGLSVTEAELEASRRIGNLSEAKEEMRNARVVHWLASSLQDLQHGVVLLRRNSGLSGLIVLVLALGIGGNAAIFTLLKAAFLDPLPFPDAGRLVTIVDRYSKLGIDRIGPTIPEYLDIRRRSSLLEEAAFLDHRDFQLTGADEPVRVSRRA
jgi:hypothetical protein